LIKTKEDLDDFIDYFQNEEKENKYHIINIQKAKRSENVKVLDEFLKEEEIETKENNLSGDEEDFELL
jgi:hypothetical protein